MGGLFSTTNRRTTPTHGQSRRWACHPGNGCHRAMGVTQQPKRQFATLTAHERATSDVHLGRVITHPARVPAAFALTRSARAITGDRTLISARARLPSRGIITSFPIPISCFHFNVLGWSYALPARGQAKPARLTPRPYHRALTRPAQTAALCDPVGPATRLTAPLRPASVAQFG